MMISTIAALSTFYPEAKNIFDPENLMNPGKIINSDPDVMVKNLRRAYKPLPERMKTDLLFGEDELALEMVRHARETGLRYGWVGADAGYGKGPGFCFALNEIDEIFVVDVHSDFPVYLKDPKPYLPEKTSSSGRPFTKYQSDQKSIEVLDLVNSLPARSWKTMTLRKTTRGVLRVRICRLKVYVWDGESERVQCWDLIVTKSLGNNPDTKISLTNAPERTTLKRLGWMQRQRYWVERAFEDGKSECGMADYQVRKWSAWHHHMALVMMAMLFMLSERIHHKDTYPLLSCADIEDLLARFLPRRDVSEEEVVFQLEQRHRQRQKAIQSHARCQAKNAKHRAHGN
jgi:hypothetical protein